MVRDLVYFTKDFMKEAGQTISVKTIWVEYAYQKAFKRLKTIVLTIKFYTSSRGKKKYLKFL